jgi:hypothetical protein
MPSRQKKNAAKKAAVPPVSSAPAPAPARQGRGMLWLVALLSLLVAATAVTYAYFEHQVADLAPSSAPAPVLLQNGPRLESMAAELDMARTRLHALEDELRAMKEKPVGADPETLRQVEAQGEQIRALTETLENARLHQQQDQTQSQLSGLIVALFALEKKLASGFPFEAEVQSLKALVLSAGEPTTPEAEEALFTLEQHAAGVSTFEALEAQFPRMAADVTRLKEEAGGHDAKARIKAFLAHFITVRSLSVTGDSPSAILARARIALEEKNLPRATQQLETLPEALKPAARPWLEAARAQIAAAGAAEKLQTLYTQTLLSHMAKPADHTAEAAPAPATEPPVTEQ